MPRVRQVSPYPGLCGWVASCKSDPVLVYGTTSNEQILLRLVPGARTLSIQEGSW